MFAHVAAFLGVSALVIATPGPDTALTIRNTLLGGRRCGAFTALGVSAGQAVWAIAAAAGLTALLRASEPAFVAIRLVGATYLVVLGLRALGRACQRRGSGGMANAGGTTPSAGDAAGLRQGLISNLGNQKMAVFFTGLLPQFAADGPESFLTLLVLGLVFCFMTLAWLTGYAIAVARAGDLLRRPRIRRALDGITGVALVLFGLRLATERVRS